LYLDFHLVLKKTLYKFDRIGCIRSLTTFPYEAPKAADATGIKTAAATRSSNTTTTSNAEKIRKISVGEQFYNWIISTHDHNVATRSEGALKSDKSSHSYPASPYVIEQPDFETVPPSWWERRTNEEKVFIYGSSLMTFLLFIYATDKYYEKASFSA
jgi:hypothetical protein